MSVRVRIICHCDAPGCERSTEATARYELVHSEALGSHLMTEFDFGRENGLVVPAVHPTPRSKWTERDGKTWCPDHSKATP